MNRNITAREYAEKNIWCENNNWSDPFYQDNEWYAFPPSGVIPLPIPVPRWKKMFFVLLLIVEILLLISLCLFTLWLIIMCCFLFLSLY